MSLTGSYLAHPQISNRPFSVQGVMMHDDSDDAQANADGSRPTLQRDPKWDAFHGFKSLDDFDALADGLSFRSEVPQDVDSCFEGTRELLRVAYTSYRLIDIACERALLCLELALKRRHDELGGPLERTGRTLFALVNWGAETGLFEDGRGMVDGLRRLRNRVAHPDGERILGPLALTVTEEVARVINELYEDPTLRRERHRACGSLNTALAPLNEQGAVADLQGVGGPRLVIFRAQALFVENRSGSPTHYIALWPLFEPGEDPNTLRFCAPITVAARSWKADEDRVILETSGSAVQASGLVAGGVVLVEPIVGGANATKYTQWRAQLEAFPLGFHGVLKYGDYHLGLFRRALRTGRLLIVRAFETQFLGSFDVPAGGSITVTLTGESPPSVRVDGPDRANSHPPSSRAT